VGSPRQLDEARQVKEMEGGPARGKGKMGRKGHSGPIRVLVLFYSFLFYYYYFLLFIFKFQI
jgi:hypothetical protein